MTTAPTTPDLVVPIFVGDDGDVTYWQPNRAPHCLIVGGRASARAASIGGTAQPFLDGGYRVWCVGGPRPDGATQWSQRTSGDPFLHADDEGEQAELLTAARIELRNRYDITTAKGHPNDPLLLVIHDPATAPAANDAITEIAALGRTARIHLLIGVAAPSAELFLGGMRDNFPVRVPMDKVTAHHPWL